MPEHVTRAYDGRCTCGRVRYRVRAEPMSVHCCHCTWCQRETGSAFVINALVETEHLEVLCGDPVAIDTPSNSGKGQKIVRCPTCHVAVYSHYAGLGEVLSFVRVGTLEESNRFTPDIHIFTSSKQPWVVLPPQVPAFAEYYDAKQVWSPESLERRAQLAAKRRGV
jgi:hypothetical protein